MRKGLTSHYKVRLAYTRVSRDLSIPRSPRDRGTTGRQRHRVPPCPHHILITHYITTHTRARIHTYTRAYPDRHQRRSDTTAGREAEQETSRVHRRTRQVGTERETTTPCLPLPILITSSISLTSNTSLYTRAGSVSGLAVPRPPSSPPPRTS